MTATGTIYREHDSCITKGKTKDGLSQEPASTNFYNRLSVFKQSYCRLACCAKHGLQTAVVTLPQVTHNRWGGAP
jgi:hypothetical protein